MTDAQAAAYQADGFEVALHLVTSGCQDFTPASLDDDLTSQLARVRGRLAERQAPGHQPHALHRLERLGHRSRRSRRRTGIRFDTNYYYNGPPGWLTQARPAHRLRASRSASPTSTAR